MTGDKIEAIARELYGVWQEAKSAEQDNWDDIKFEDLPEKHQEEYVKTAKRIGQLFEPTTACCAEGRHGLCDGHIRTPRANIRCECSCHEPKADEEGLLSPEKTQSLVREWINEDFSVRIISLNRGHWEGIAPVIAAAQDKKTSAAKDAECQARVEEAYKKGFNDGHNSKT